MLSESLEMIIAGAILVIAIAVYGWIEYRRTTRHEDFGLAMVKNRLNAHRSNSLR